MIKVTPDQEKILALNPANEARLQAVVDDEINAIQRGMFLALLADVTTPLSGQQFADVAAILAPNKNTIALPSGRRKK